ncbi:hypothetical protein PLESTB_001183600 [Pleodorina starrii]|uniref:Uncharacterized protein n=1 Tax=Pleodorina starrii TaxID=330485 RepID=A0A9W6F5E1_9CHLO|nr:hypothetical protein PLESTM_000259700 [Pleodorina starrii]GLC57102.1 hypothetical protein PLESTB_001183600 [Pleodorina starrii]GLC64937.1 hypothetical protein PLESTF_000223900 [Pleodorina starrii]
MGSIVTPQYVRELAAALDVRNAAEWALPFHLASAPLPEGWTYVIAENGSVSYMHDVRSPQREHPLLDRAAQALARLRAIAASGTGSGAGSGTGAARFLGPFENLDSPAVVSFYLDVESGAQVPELECPPASLIAPLPPDVLQLLYATPTSSPYDTERQQKPQQQQQHQEQQQQQQQQEEVGGGGSQPVSPAPAEPDASTTGAREEEAPGRGGGSSGVGGGAGAGARPLDSSRPESTSGRGQSAASTSAAAASPSQAPKPTSREGSGRSVGTGAAGRSTVSPSTPAATEARPSRPASAASTTSPQPAPPAAAPPRSYSGLTAEEAYDEEDRAVFQRDVFTTAGSAGSVSDVVSSSGRGVGGGGRRSGSGSGRGSGSGAGEGAGESLGRSGSARSGGSGGSAADGGMGAAARGSRSFVAASGIGLRPPVAPPSGRLTFYGWWFEDIESSDLTFRIDTKPQAGGGLAPRHCTLLYDFATASYCFTMRDPVTPPAPGQPYERVPELTVPGLGGEQVAMVDTGRPADLWDLHLGARLRVLGRQVVLKNSDLATAQWHAGYFRQLCGLRDKLSVEVQKYKPRVLRPGLVYDKGDVRLQTGQQLRHVALQVRELLEDLRQYRPAKAESFLAALPIQF